MFAELDHREQVLALIGLACLVVAIVLMLVLPPETPPRRYLAPTQAVAVATRADDALTYPSRREVRSAFTYAAWCGGVVQVEPLPHNGYDVVVVSCDQ